MGGSDGTYRDATEPMLERIRALEQEILELRAVESRRAAAEQELSDLRAQIIARAGGVPRRPRRLAPTTLRWIRNVALVVAAFGAGVGTTAAVVSMRYDATAVVPRVVDVPPLRVVTAASAPTQPKDVVGPPVADLLPERGERDLHAFNDTVCVTGVGDKTKCFGRGYGELFGSYVDFRRAGVEVPFLARATSVGEAPDFAVCGIIGGVLDCKGFGTAITTPFGNQPLVAFASEGDTMCAVTVAGDALCTTRAAAGANAGTPTANKLPVAHVAEIAMQHDVIYLRRTDGVLLVVRNGAAPGPSLAVPTPAAQLVASIRGIPALGQPCALRPDGRVVCWDDAMELQSAIDPVLDLDDAVDLASDASSACAVSRDGSVRCRQGGRFGGAIETIAAVHDVRRIVALTKGFCALDKDGAVTCWGDTYEHLQAATPAEPHRILGIDGPAPRCSGTCRGRECGEDGCGNSCGACPSEHRCTAAGRCELLDQRL